MIRVEAFGEGEEWTARVIGGFGPPVTARRPDLAVLKEITARGDRARRGGS